MKKSYELLVYALLILSAGGLSLLVVTDILRSKKERIELGKTEETWIAKVGDEAFQPTPIETAIAVFNERPDLFSLLVTPKPSPTQPIVPTPTNTPVPLVTDKWLINNIINDKMVQLTTGDGKRSTYKVGDGIPKSPPNAIAYIVYKIDKANGRVFLWRKTDNVMGWFNKAGGVEYATELPQ